MHKRVSLAVLAAFATLILLPASASAAPIDVPLDTKNQVMAVTAIGAMLLLGLATVGYLYRREKGMVAPPEDTGAAGGHH